jgi:hypothetical protein
MTRDDRIQRSCSAPSANRYPYCGCDGCLHAYKLKKRQRRREASKGEHVCECGHRFQTLHGLRAHRGKVHGYALAVAS